MNYTPKKYDFNPPRKEANAGITKEAEARKNLRTINNMLACTTDPAARSGLIRRHNELKKDLDRYDTKRQAHARALWHGLIEKRNRKESRLQEVRS